MANSALINKPPSSAVDSQNGGVTEGWANFFSAVWRLLNGMTQSGPPENFPGTSTNNQDFLWAGQPFFDTSLGTYGKPVWLGKDGKTWVDATGTPV